MEEKRPRARHRFNFSGKSRNREVATTTDQILSSLKRQAQLTGNIGEDEGNLVEESVLIDDLEEPAEYSRGRSIGRWLFIGMLLGIGFVLWAFGLFPRILYADTVGSIDNLVSMVPRVDIVIVVIIWMAALVIGLLGRRARHVSKMRL